MKTGRIVILSGPSGSGKTTLYKQLLASPCLRRVLVKSVSVTTRPRRPGERSGKDYIFMSEKEFLSRRKTAFFLEWQKVFLYYYGTPARKVQALLRQGKNVLMAIDVKGARVVWQKHPDALKLFVKTPSLKVLKDRLVGRATEEPKDLAVRLATAKAELREAKNYDQVIVNDQLDRCYQELERVLLKELQAKV